MLKMNELTSLEQKAIREVYTEETGYIYFDETSIPAKQMRGVFSSLEQKGIIVPTYDQPFEAYPADEYEGWFF